MIDPTWLIIGFFFVTMLFLVFIGAFVYDVRHILKASKTALEAIQHSTHGTWYISHDLKSAMEGVRNELQQQNKFIERYEEMLFAAPDWTGKRREAKTSLLPEPNTDALPAATHGKSTGRPKKERNAVTVHAGTDTRYDATVTNLPAIKRESIRS